jgi:ATP-dependent DNA ligase
MHPTLLLRPFHHEGWIYEEKVDGYRMVVYKEEDGVRLVSRNGRDHTRRGASGLRLEPSLDSLISKPHAGLSTIFQ